MPSTKTTNKKRKRTRKKRKVEDDFIIEDDAVCKACGAPTIFDEEYCPACLAASKITDIVEERLEAKDVMGALLGAAGSVVLQAGRPALQRFVTRVVESAKNVPNQGPRAPNSGPRPAQRKKPESPWPVLGLDPMKATIADVKRVQRKLAEIYHPDKAAPAVHPEMLARVNAAADAAVAWLKEQGRK